MGNNMEMPSSIDIGAFFAQKVRMKVPVKSVNVGCFCQVRKNSVQTLPPHKDSYRRPQNYFHPETWGRSPS